MSMDTSTEAVARLLEGVTPGPWCAEFRDKNEKLWLYGPADNVTVIGGCGCCGSPFGDNLERDAIFIVAARELVPALSARVAELEDNCARLETAHRQMQKAHDDRAAERDELACRVEELEASGEKVAAEFEGDCWKAIRSLLNQCDYDWHDAYDEGVTADDALTYLSEVLSEGDADYKRIAAERDAAIRALSEEGRKRGAAEAERDALRAVLDAAACELAGGGQSPESMLKALNLIVKHTGRPAPKGDDA